MARLFLYDLPFTRASKRQSFRYISHLTSNELRSEKRSQTDHKNGCHKFSPGIIKRWKMAISATGWLIRSIGRSMCMCTLPAISDASRAGSCLFGKYHNTTIPAAYIRVWYDMVFWHRPPRIVCKYCGANNMNRTGVFWFATDWLLLIISLCRVVWSSKQSVIICLH